MKIDDLNAILAKECSVCPGGWMLGELMITLSEEDRAFTITQKVPKVLLKLRTKDIKHIKLDEDGKALTVTVICNKSAHSFRTWRG